MTYPQYKADLQRIHESEVYGIALFEAAVRVTRSKERKLKWSALKALEEMTLARYLDYMKASGQRVTARDSAEGLGAKRASGRCRAGTDALAPGHEASARGD